jgi:hypothetical protein
VAAVMRIVLDGFAFVDIFMKLRGYDSM